MMYKVESLFFLLLVGIATLAQGQVVAVPGAGDYTIAPEDEVCRPLALSFQTNFAAPPVSTCTPAVVAASWNKFKAAYTGAVFTGYTTATSKAQCDAAANNLPTPEQAAALALCTNVETMATACACEKLGCVNDSVNREVVVATPHCIPFPAKMCTSLQASVGTTCAAEIARVGALTPSAGVIWNAPSAQCVPADCKVATGQTVNVPGAGDFVVAVNEAACVPLANSFATKYGATTPPATCTASLGGSALWNKYKVVFSGTLFPAMGTSTSKATCDTAAQAVAAGADRTTALAMCGSVEELTEECACDKLACVTDSVNTEITPATSTPCNPFPQKMCRSLQSPVNVDCTAAIATGTALADAGRVVFTAPTMCLANQCRLPAAAPSPSSALTTCGTYGAAAVVALVGAAML